MFSRPRTWVDGESGVRNESLNMGLPENLEAFRSVFLKRIGLSTRSSQEIQVLRTTPENAKSTWVYVDFSGTIHRGWSSGFAPALYDYYGLDPASARRPNVMEKPAVLWVPFDNINAAKKSSENLYIKSEVSFIYRKAAEDQYQISDSVLSYEYLGSTTDQGPITSAEKTTAWSPQLSTSSYRVKLVTEEVLLDTSDMSTTDVSVAAFRFRLKQFGMRQIEEGFGSDTFEDFSIQVELVIK